MSKHRWAAKTDANQTQIMEQLRNMGVSVEPRHDDLLIGYRGKTFWFEVKNPLTALKADGVTFYKGAIKESQSNIRKTWRGHYSVVTHINQILNQIGFNN